MEAGGKTATVVGLGNSGFNAAMLLKGASWFVRATDSADTPSSREAANRLRASGIGVEIGAHTEGFIKGSSIIVVSPGVEDTSPALKWALKLGIPVIGEMELGFRFCKGRIIAITGTNGKSTVTALIGEILKKSGKDTVVCGNIGNCLCGEIGRITEDTWVVLEVSSFQLEKIEHFRPHMAVILNITDDHMDRYKRFSDYFGQKLKIFANQTEDDILILNHDAVNLRTVGDKARARRLFYSRLGAKEAQAVVKKGSLYCSLGPKGEREICRGRDIRLKGLHNVENILASSLASILAGADEDSVKTTVMNFKGLDHRFETVTVIDGVEYIDDSKGTTVDSTIRALESCDRPLILIAGGNDKNSDYGRAANIIKKKVKSLVLIGEAKKMIRDSMGASVAVHDAKDMSEAVEISRGLAKENYIVLLSPMCSSFDMFSSYKERGEVFRNAVWRLKDGVAI